MKKKTNKPKLLLNICHCIVCLLNITFMEIKQEKNQPFEIKQLQKKTG